ncbi:hypothetical protein [Streptomyces sp. NPDC014744]|uniref:hypothetical protein n=1 Tax=Streptomyces sp. NPDC014744 TaxID=3364903 RepID=UPI0036FE51A8
MPAASQVRPARLGVGASVPACTPSGRSRVGTAPARDEGGLRPSDKDIGVALSNGNDKQRALLTIDAAASHLRSGDADAAFALASRALGEGIRLRSGKIVERARRLRSTYTDPGRTAMVREFDAQLHATYL